MITTDDGVPLAVREVGPKDAKLTVVFAHGFCLRMSAFHFQRARLAEQWGDQVRMVFYDQRGHGRSGEAPPDTYTVEQLGRDLESVLAVTAPRGPVVLVGHSMGGMTVLSHARQFPQRYPARIVGAALISSAAEGVDAPHWARSCATRRWRPCGSLRVMRRNSCTAHVVRRAR